MKHHTQHFPCFPGIFIFMSSGYYKYYKVFPELGVTIAFRNVHGSEYEWLQKLIGSAKVSKLDDSENKDFQELEIIQVTEQNNLNLNLPRFMK